MNNSVISAAGGSDKNNFISLDWVLGEAFIESSSTGNEMITSGFLQPLLVRKNVETAADFKVTVAPNPFQSLLNVKILTPVHQKLLLLLADSKGNIIQTKTLAPDQLSETLVLQNYASGNYVLQVRDASGKLFTSFFVSKIR